MPLEHPKQFVALNVFTAHPDPYIWLIELMDPLGGPVLDENGNTAQMLLTPNATSVLYAGNTYQPYPVEIGKLARDSTGGSAEITLAFSNALAQMSRLVESNNYFREYRVRLTLVHSTLLNNANANTQINGKVTDVSTTWSTITLRMSAYDNLDFDVPQELIVTKCGWVYRGRGCEFEGDLTPTLNFEMGPCSKTLSACKLRGQWQVDNEPSIPDLASAEYPLFFGGFPGLLVGSFS